MLCKDRHGNVVIGENSQDNLLKLLYGSVPGRLFLRVLTRPFISGIVGDILNTKLSCGLIQPFIRANDIDMSEYDECEYNSYNEFFTRDIKKSARPVDMDENVLISPSDGRVSAYRIDENSVFRIKDSYYTVQSITNSRAAAERYMNGYCVIVRLCVDNYHRYCYIDNGVLGKTSFIDGVLHTVNPEALAHYDIYKENCRECSILHTEHFGNVMQIEVGALFVGKIKNHHTFGTRFCKGDEKGLFEFGGSTVVLFIEKDKVIIDEDLLLNTENGYETAVKMGEHIGIMPGTSALNGNTNLNTV